MNNRFVRRRLEAAFRELEKDGIICRGNFACCTSCASYELDQLMAGKDNIMGAIYWHSQDEEDFKRSGRVMIGFLSKKDDPVSYEQVARRAVQALENAGLGVFWEGTAARKIEVFLKGQKPQACSGPVSPAAKELIRRTGMPIAHAEEVVRRLSKKELEDLIKKLKERKSHD